MSTTASSDQGAGPRSGHESDANVEFHGADLSRVPEEAGTAAREGLTSDAGWAFQSSLPRFHHPQAPRPGDVDLDGPVHDTAHRFAVLRRTAAGNDPFLDVRQQHDRRDVQRVSQAVDVFHRHVRHTPVCPRAVAAFDVLDLVPADPRPLREFLLGPLPVGPKRLHPLTDDYRVGLPVEVGRRGIHSHQLSPPLDNLSAHYFVLLR